MGERREGAAGLIGVTVLVAAAYWITGRLGLELAVPPGYATAVWPPSGIALAAVLLLGPRALLGVAIGSFLLNLTISLTIGAAPFAPSLSSLAPPFLIGLGAMAQAGVGAWLTRRHRCWPSRLERGREIVGLLLLGGPVACLINATWSVGWLRVFGVMPSEGLALNWLTWWGGDVIGVAVFTPLVMSWSNRAAGGRRRAALSTAGLATGFLIVILVMIWTSALNERRIAERFDEVGPVVARALERAVAAQMSAVTAVAGMSPSEHGLSESTFTDFTDRLREIVPTIQSLEWAPLIPEADRAAFERTRGFPITGLADRAGGLTAVAAGGRHAPVTLVNPMATNGRALGFDLLSEPVRRAALERAERTGRPTVSGAIDLVRGGRGVLAVAPAAEEKGRVIGFAVVAVGLDGLVAHALQSADVRDVSHWLVDVTAGGNGDGVMLSASSDGPPADFVLAERGLFGRSARLGFEERVETGGRTWSLRLAPTPAFIARHDSENRLLLLIAGMLLTGMVGGGIMLVVGREAILAAQVAERTESLTAQGVVLRRQLENMRAVNAIAATRSESLDALLTDALRLALSHLGLSVGIVSRIGEGTHTIDHLAAPKDSVLRRGGAIDMGAACGRVAGAASDVFGSDRAGGADACPCGFVEALGFKAHIGAPFTVNGEVHGVVFFAGEEPYPRPFDDGDREFIRLLAAWVGAVIERRELAGDLARTARRLEAILANAPVGVLIVDLDRRIRLVNPGMTELLGRDEAELIGAETRVLYPDDETWERASVAAYPALVQGETPDFEALMARSDGARVWTRVIGRMLSADDSAEGAIWIVSDISARMAAEVTLRQRTEALERSNAELEAFAYVASHDLRQPLRSVTNYLTLLERELAADLPDEPREYMRIAREGAKRMDLLIVDLLEYARVGRTEGGFTPHPVAELVSRAVGGLRAAIDESGATIDVAEPTPVVRCVGGELQRLFMNLIGNAIKYRAPDRPPEVRVACADDGDRWRITVADNGIGIAEEHHERVFGIFQRLHGRLEYEGTGIGLAICRKVVDHHGGAIHVESRLGGGSVFIVELPKVPPSR